MITMTSLEAQNRFGELIDTSLREPVLITRRGRPVSFVISPKGDAQTALFQFMKVVSELSPLRGQEASEEISRVLSGLGRHAEPRLAETDVGQMINDPD